MCGLHRLLDGFYELVLQLGEVNHVVQRGREIGHYFARIVFAAIKALVDATLNEGSQWLKQRCDHERGSYQHECILLGLASHPIEQ